MGRNRGRRLPPSVCPFTGFDKVRILTCLHEYSGLGSMDQSSVFRFKECVSCLLAFRDLFIFIFFIPWLKFESLTM